jgi:Copper amine oxidase N-terminal domain
VIHRASELYAALRWQSVAIVALCALAISCVLAFSTPIAMFVDGERVDSDVAPVTTASERAFVPLRSIADALGAETVVDKPGVITVTLGDQTLRLRVGDTHAKLNGMPLTLKRAPFRVRGRVLVSIDAIARALHVRATYDPRTARIEVRTPGVGEVQTP